MSISLPLLYYFSFHFTNAIYFTTHVTPNKSFILRQILARRISSGSLNLVKQIFPILYYTVNINSSSEEDSLVGEHSDSCSISRNRYFYRPHIDTHVPICVPLQDAPFWCLNQRRRPIDSPPFRYVRIRRGTLTHQSISRISASS